MRERFTRGFLWISVIAWGVLVGAKLFDLRVLAGAWSASPPESLSMLPYGAHWPVDTGEFFIPVSAAVLVSTLGALVAGWSAPPRYRFDLAISFAMIFAVLVLTVVAFWPRNAALWAVAQGGPRALHDHTAIVRMVRQWIVMDWTRVAMGTTGFIASVRAIGTPYVAVDQAAALRPRVKLVFGVVIAGVLLFVVYFVSKI